MNQLQEFASILRGESVPIFLLRGLRTFWRDTPSFWFSHAPLDTWEITHTAYTDTLDTNMHLLLHYDQIVRHPTSEGHPCIPNTSQSLAFRFAVSLALHMIHCGQYATAEPWERVFILLALRHAKVTGLKELALRKCLREAETDPSPLWCRFLNATVWDVASWNTRGGYAVEPVVDLDSLHTFAHLLAGVGVGVGAGAGAGVGATADMQKEFRRLLAVRPEPRIAVSISGGVDSMVAATVARDVCRQVGKELVLLHISYRNRPECEDECNLVRWWGQRLGVPVYIRRITEIQRVRQSGLRTVYEEVTRRIRFAFYKWFECPVILGHNLDDCYENIFSNLAKQIHLDNLYGMRDVGEEQGVVILRPLLEIPKSAIVNYADCMGVPHLYDSTPAWSRRGQMRDKLIPGIREFDVGILEGLRAVVERTRFLEAQWEQAFERWVVGCAGCAGCADYVAKLPRDEFLESNKGEFQFWVRFYQRLGIPRPSNKSIRNCMEMLERRCEGICTLSQDIHMQIGKEALVLIRRA